MSLSQNAQLMKYAVWWAFFFAGWSLGILLAVLTDNKKLSGFLRRLKLLSAFIIGNTFTDCCRFALIDTPLLGISAGPDCGLGEQRVLCWEPEGTFTVVAISGGFMVATVTFSLFLQCFLRGNKSLPKTKWSRRLFLLAGVSVLISVLIDGVFSFLRVLGLSFGGGSLPAGALSLSLYIVNFIDRILRLTAFAFIWGQAIPEINALAEGPTAPRTTRRRTKRSRRRRHESDYDDTDVPDDMMMRTSSQESEQTRQTRSR